MYSTNSFSNFPHITGANFNLIQNSTNQVQGVGTVNQTSTQNLLTPGGSQQLQQTNSIQTGLTNLQNSLTLNGNIHGSLTQLSNIVTSSLGWPLFNPLINVPHFDLETYGSVNLDANCSQYRSGVDLPLHDITTLRFFYNFGVHQAKEILLKQQALKNTTPSNAQIIALVQQVQQQNTNNHQNDNEGGNLLQKQHNIGSGMAQNIAVNHNNHQNNSLSNNANSLNILQSLQSQPNNVSSIGSILNQQSKPNQISNHTQSTPFKINMLNNLQPEQSTNQLNLDNVLAQNVFGTNNLPQQPSTINEQPSTQNYSSMSSLSIALHAAKNGHPGAQSYIQELLKMRNEVKNTFSHTNLHENNEMAQYSSINSPNVSITRGNYFSISSSPKGPIPVDPAPPVCQSLNIISKPIPTTSSNQTLLFENTNINLNSMSSSVNTTIHQYNNDMKQISLSEKTQGVNKLFPQCKSLLQHTKDSVGFNNTIDQLPMGSKRRTEDPIKGVKNNDIAFKSVLLNDDVLNVTGTSENHYIEFNTSLKNDENIKNSNELLHKTISMNTDQRKEFIEPQKLLNHDKLSLDSNSSKAKKVIEYNTESKNVNATLTPATALLAATEMHYTQTFTKNKNDSNDSSFTSNDNSLQASDIKSLIDQTKNENHREMSLTGSQQNSSKSSPQNSIISSNISTRINDAQNNIPESFLKSVNNSQKEQQYVEQPPLAPSLMINFLSCYFSQCKNQLQSHGTTLHLDDHGNPIDYSSRPIDPIFRNAKKETGASIETLQPGSTSTMPELDTPIKESDLVSEAQQSVLVKNGQKTIDINREKIIELSVNNVTGIGEKRPYVGSVFSNPDEKKIKIVKNEDT
uniref:C2H2-type domain-containing protein n=1 Tax=Strongyloides venezuelensis TaxID=75913 RepID=A0A0K0FK21_STRVS